MHKCEQHTTATDTSATVRYADISVITTGQNAVHNKVQNNVIFQTITNAQEVRE